MSTMTDPFGTEAMFPAPDPPVSDVGPLPEPPRRKRGRPSNAERAARSGTPPPPPKKNTGRPPPKAVRRPEEYAKRIADVMEAVGVVAGLRDPVLMEIVADGTPNFSRAMGKFAAHNDLIGNAIDKISTSSELMEVVIAGGAILVPVLARMGVLRNTPLRDAAEPYVERVAARMAEQQNGPPPFMAEPMEPADSSGAPAA